MINIGILAVQGGYQAHIDKIKQVTKAQSPLANITFNIVKITNSNEIDKIDALVIPGGESSVFLKLLDSNFKSKLIESNIPTLSTCAGIILLAKKVSNPAQESFGLLDIEVKRNAYGRQLESFKTNELIWEETNKIANFDAIFIRAPKIIKTGKEVKVLLTHNGEAVLVRQGKHLAATFHPELTKELAEQTIEQSSSIHEMFLTALI